MEFEEEKSTNREEKNTPNYISREGFDIVPLLRGFTEISKLWWNIHVFGVFICGGYARYCASPNKNPVMGSDVDIYCPDEEIFNEVSKHFKDNHLEIKHENNMALTYSRPQEGIYRYTPTI